MHAWALTQEAYVHAHLGAVEETRAVLAGAAEPVRLSANPLPGLWIAASLALLELSLGNAEAAWAACEPLVRPLEEHGIREPVPAFFLPDALEALISLGELDRAERLIDQLERQGRELERAWALASGARCRALLLAARGDLAGSGAAASRALAEFERLEMRFDCARTLLVKGVSERRAKKRARAKTSLEEALAEFERLGAALWAERARSELGRADWRRTSDGELTVTEQRVAELAAGGLTNREVAAALFVSAKTVEANLARIYRKLGIRSRAELGARMNSAASAERKAAVGTTGLGGGS